MNSRRYNLTLAALVLGLMGLMGLMARADNGGYATVCFQLTNWCRAGVVTNRQVLVTPLWLTASGAVPVYDRKRLVSDATGTLWVTNMMVGVYDCDVMGPPDKTSFWIYVDPSNAVQNAATHMVVRTNVTAGPERLAYSMSASDARYAPAGTTVANVLFSSDGMTNQAGYLATSGNAGVAVGYNSSGLQSGVALGYAASANLNGVAIGNEPNADDNGVAIGSSTIAGNYGIAIGSGAAGTINGVAIGNGGFAASYGASIGGNSQASNYGVAIGFGATGSDNGVGVGNGTDGSGFGVAVGSGATSGGGAGSVAVGGAYGTNTAVVPNGWTNTVELGPGTATLAGGLNFRGYGMVNSNGVWCVNGRPGITTNVLCGSRTLLITNGIVLGVQ